MHEKISTMDKDFQRLVNITEAIDISLRATPGSTILAPVVLFGTRYGLHSPRNSQAQTDFVQDNQDNAINGVCYNMGQEESKTRVSSLHM